MTSEEWRTIPGHPGYEASSTGRIRSWVSAGGRSARTEPLILQRVWPDGRQYPVVALGRSMSREVHYFVTLAFHGPRPDPSLVVRHLNGDPADNSIVNLVYGTRSENAYDTVRHGRSPLAARTHCKNGHEFTTENTLYTPPGSTTRRCRACQRAADRRRRQPERAKS